MNRNAKIAVGFTLVALAVSAAHAQDRVRVMQTGGMKNVTLMMNGGGGYTYYTGGGEGAGQNNATKDDLFAGTEQFEKNATEVSEITMDPDSLDMVKGPMASNAHSMVLNLVRTYEYDKPGMYDMAAVDRFREKLNTGDWHCAVHTRELKTGESTDVCYKRRTDGYREEAIITVEPKELTFIHRIRKEGAGGHSDVSGLPMVFGGDGLPLVAELEGPAMAAEMKAQIAAMRALSPELDQLTFHLQELQNVKPLDPKQFQALQQQFKNFKVTVPDVHISPDVHVSPNVTIEPPAKPEE